MKKIFSLFAVVLFAISAVAQTNLFDPAAAYIPEGGTYFATGPNWEVETNSSATYDATTGTLLVDLKSQFSSQWQAQVKLQHNMVFDPAKQYTLSIKQSGLEICILKQAGEIFCGLLVVGHYHSLISALMVSNKILAKKIEFLVIRHRLARSKAKKSR